MFKQITVYRLQAAWNPTLEEMEQAMDGHRFVPTGSTQTESVGWVEPRGEPNGPLVESISGQRIMRLRIETKSVPKAMVNKKAQEAADEIERLTGRKPGKKETKALREDALMALLPQAFPKESAIHVWIDPERELLVTDAGSQSANDTLVTAMVRAFPSLQLSLLNTQITPQTGMTGWLGATTNEDWPTDFSIERECELKSSDEEKSLVKFCRHHLANDEVRHHIAQGKRPTKLAMSYDGRIRFMLTESMQVKKIEFLEGVFENRADKEEEDGFDTDVTIATGELRRLIPALVDALGGELMPGDMPYDQSTGQAVGPQEQDHLDRARHLVTQPDGRASISFIQRKLAIGYNSAARLLEELERQGVVSAMRPDGSREVLHQVQPA
jgi:recombination associated protein RdgC